MELDGPSDNATIFHINVKSGNLLNEYGSFKVLNGLLTELRLDVVSTEPHDHVNVGGKVPVRLNNNENFTLPGSKMLSSSSTV